ncbi:MAG TPA: FHA domain-containing protein [Pyrinomonadaceae bacterium]|nr:FHA domain-containing protein [Pyrinomonadaceae bacterium]
MPFLVVTPPRDTPVAYELARETLTMGRSRLNDICLTDPLSAAVHAEVRFERGRYLLTNLADEIGTYYNGEFVSSTVPLSRGAQIVIGTTEIEFHDLVDLGVRIIQAGTASRSETDRNEVIDEKKTLMYWLGESPEDAIWLAPVLFTRAAESYEAIGLWRAAAECWTEARGSSEALRIYLREHDHERAAPLLMAQGRYAEALESYSAWLSKLRQDDVLARVNALLGRALSLSMMQTDSAAASESYSEARSLVEAQSDHDVLTTALCWEALAVYGTKIGRYDLVQIGYEEALNRFGNEHNDERLRIGWNYLAAVSENRLLVAEIESRLSEWVPAEDELPTNGTSDTFELGEAQGARFGDWTVWRAGSKEVIFVHPETKTGIQIWTDSPGWFRWGAPTAEYLVRSDGSNTGNVGRLNVARYVSNVPTKRLRDGSSDIDNYRFIWSSKEFRVVNRVKGGTIIISPDNVQFDFLQPNGIKISLGGRRRW